MKKGTIYKHTWLGQVTYFVDMKFYEKGFKGEAEKTGGYELSCVDGEWQIEKVSYYLYDLKYTENFQIFGHVDIDNVIREAIQDAIQRGEKE